MRLEMNLLTTWNRMALQNRLDARVSRLWRLWLGLMLLLLALPATALAAVPPACAIPPDYTSLSKCIDEGTNNVVIGIGATKIDFKNNVIADQNDFSAGKITVPSGGV